MNRIYQDSEIFVRIFPTLLVRINIQKHCKSQTLAGAEAATLPDLQLNLI